MKLRLRKAVAVLAAAGTVCALGIGTATAAGTGRAVPGSVASTRQSPTPDCADNGNVNPCYEYQTWFWTFAACNDYTNNHPLDPAKYDRHVCAVFTDGATVGLWYHKVNG
ncbi:hypothetical protein [Kitasatospora sp. MAP5-34]|uniref:hypothetical protein n=1 Tax=Kitasatospora sp. MAP5-34 TaxID=3035102 RepID=UPI002473AE67|nr:hypothetical protein [Kitasatospora sp. MAP5-34]MDH6577768.1 hypothetical protein [Kitasatospora sp. MAP5-34]